MERLRYVVIFTGLLLIIGQGLLVLFLEPQSPRRYGVERHDLNVTPKRDERIVTVNDRTENASIKPKNINCPEYPPDLIGHLKININESIDLDELRKRNQGLKKGGFWTPHDCAPRSRVIIIVPHRNRWSHLIQWLAHYHPILQRQKLEYRIVVTEQVQRNLFNKGRLYNAAFLECERAFDFDCVIFHDVDMLLENDHNMYWCYNMTRPRHLSPAVDKFRYQLPYHILVGGVLAMTRHMFKRVNGFSNQFWGWGGEDDDMWGRLVAVNTTVDRPPPTIGRYTMIKHRTRKGERNFMLTYRLVLLATSGSRWSRDGLNDVRDYCKLTQVAHEPLFTHFVFDVGNQPRQKPRNT